MTAEKSSGQEPPVFVVGTGRSGTTLLLRLFASHKEVFAPLSETRFIVEFGGLLDLIESLSSQYSPARARQALYQFEHMMRVDLVEPRSRPYFGYDLPATFGDNYWRALDNFCDALLQYEFVGIDHPIPATESRLMRSSRSLVTRWQSLRKRWLPQPAPLPRPVIREPRYFSNRDELITLARDYLSSLFDSIRLSSEKLLWCEKTPHHLFHVGFLLELFPDARIVHAIRDPRDIACSYTRQLWAPSRLEDAASMLESVYKAWFDRRDALSLDSSNYKEIRLEDLVASPEPTLASLQEFCGLTVPFDPSKVKRLAPQRENFSQAELSQAEAILKPFIDRLGY